MFVHSNATTLSVNADLHHSNACITQITQMTCITQITHHSNHSKHASLNHIASLKSLKCLHHSNHSNMHSSVQVVTWMQPSTFQCYVIISMFHTHCIVIIWCNPATCPVQWCDTYIPMRNRRTLSCTWHGAMSTLQTCYELHDAMLQHDHCSD